MESLKDCWAWIEGFTNFERRPGTQREYRLDRMRDLLDILGSPQNRLVSLHVAGSKGKGSIASLLATGLHAAGYRPLLYRSPHIRDYRERITMAGEFFPDAVYLACLKRLRQHLEEARRDGRLESEPTTFELLTSLAFMLGQEAGCNIQVIEVGLGGRLDATNVLERPLASIITSLELEHTDILGPSIGMIAAEKAGIMKQGCPVYSFPQEPEALKVLESRAQELGCALKLPLASSPAELEELRTGIQINWEGAQTEIDGKIWRTRVPGKIHLLNLVFAARVLEDLAQDSGIVLKSGWKKDMQDLLLPGRMEQKKLSWEGVELRLVMDGAHTGNSARILRDNLASLDQAWILVLGVVNGKNLDGIAAALLPLADSLIVTTPGTFKASNPELLFHACRGLAEREGLQVDISLIPDTKTALLTAIKEAAAKGLGLLVSGSFYLLGEIERVLEEFGNP